MFQRETEDTMCTISWLHTANGYHLLCNRDERHTRDPSLAPEIQDSPCMRFIAPIDVETGGSWVAANEAGLCFSLVNRYLCSRCRTENKTKPPSRGILLTALADSHSLEDTQRRFERLDLEPYLPFTMGVLAPGASAMLLHWTGRHSLIEHNGDPAMPLVSSSFDPRGIEVYRRRLFERLAAERGGVDLKMLMDFHTSHLPEASAYSPCMHRENSTTVSFSRVTVRDDLIEFVYFPAAPCRWKMPAIAGDTGSGWKLVQMRLIDSKPVAISTTVGQVST